MELLYSNILPLGIKDGQRTIIDCFKEQIAKADRVEIAVGYISLPALIELERLVEENKISSICLNIGMYYIEGMPERSYHKALEIHRKWKEAGIGEIRLIKSFKYHGKVYCFYKNEAPFAAIVGSANLGVIKLDATNRRQYETAIFMENKIDVSPISEHVEDLKGEFCSGDIATLQNIPVIREKNTALNGIESVTPVPQINVEFYKQQPAEVEFELLLKVPRAEERFLDDGRHFTKSNINVCYGAPRNKRKARNWYETQITVGAKIYKQDGYPKKNEPFFIITDDGYWFKAHTTSDNNKQFSAWGDELIMGRWLKGRLVAAGLVNPVNNTAEDTQREGMITQEILDEYGCDRLLFKKTGQVAIDESGDRLDVWMLSFIGKIGNK